MNLGNESQIEVIRALRDALEKLKMENRQAAVVTDIHLQPCSAGGELFIFDDEDRELSRARVKEWSNDVPEGFYARAEYQLRPLVEMIEKEGFLDGVPLMKPYSFVLVDNDHETVAELLLIDDDTVMLNNGLLQGLDEELNDFLKKLLEE